MQFNCSGTATDGQAAVIWHLGVAPNKIGFWRSNMRLAMQFGHRQQGIG
jgi:hypothetical protein